jgi:hypothetical protein
MRFSLKDLMWSVTFASLGIGMFLASYRSDNMIAVIPMVLLPGMLCGAAIGRLFHRAIDGATTGLFIWVAIIVYLSLPQVG